jgi:hypothetical protein
MAGSSRQTSRTSPTTDERSAVGFRRVVAAAATALCLVSCGAAAKTAQPPGSNDSVRTKIVEPGAEAAGTVLPPDDARRRYTVGSMLLCLSGPPMPALITSVTPFKGNGHISITDFATRPNPFTHHEYAIGSSFKSLTALGFPDSQPEVTGPCHTTVEPSTSKTVPASDVELGLTYKRVGDLTGSDQGAVVHYTVDGVNKQMLTTISVVMCAPDDHTTRLCQ